MVTIKNKNIRAVINTFKDFFGGDALKYSASLSYYTVFSLAPLLIIIIGVAGIFYGTQAITGELHQQFAGLMGTSVADFIQETIKNVKVQGHSWLATVVGVGTLLLGATGVFAELQNSLNKIWSVKVDSSNGLMRFLMNRVISFSMIITLGFLLMVSLIINSAINLFLTNYVTFLADWKILTLIINNVLVFGIVTFLFAFIFKFLPDVKLRWSNVWVGAMFTTVLFMIGKYFIGTYLSQSAMASAFGAAGSLAIILSWVYYSSAILFLGAEFTKNYALVHETPIESEDYSTFVVQKEKELDATAQLQDMQAACAKD